MARRTLADMDAELLTRLANRLDLTEAQRLQFLHDAYMHVAKRFPHPEFEASTLQLVLLGEGQLAANTPDIWWPMYVRNVTTDRAVDSKTITAVEQDTRVSGPITEYYWFGNQFIFNRLADQDTTLKVWYKVKPLEMELTDSPLFNRDYDILLPMKAAAIAFDTVGNLQESHIQTTMYENYVASNLIPHHEAERNDNKRGIRVRTR